MSVIQPAEVLLVSGKCGQFFQPAIFQLAPWDEGAGIDFQVSQGTAAGIGSENLLQEFDFLEDRTPAEFFRFDPVDKEGNVFRHNQGHHPDMALVLAVALVETEQAMAFAQEEIDRVDDLDVIEYRRPLAQPGQPLLWDSVNTGHQIDDPEW